MTSDTTTLPSIPAFVSLAVREWRRFVRQPTRALGALGAAALFWLFLGAGFSELALTTSGATVADESTPPGVIPYAGYLVPGVALIVVMFAVVTWSIGLIQDRASGFLQSALVSPAPLWTIVGAKIAVGAAAAGVQGLVVLLATPLAGLPFTPLGALGAAAILTLAAAGVMAVSLALAWRIDSVAGFHGVMNVGLLPLWALSGAVFPLDAAAGWLRVIMLCNPLTWANESAGAMLGARTAAQWWHTPALAAAVVAVAVVSVTSMRRAASGRSTAAHA
jgi:ABC-2 type transport system permease protein